MKVEVAHNSPQLILTKQNDKECTLNVQACLCKAVSLKEQICLRRHLLFKYYQEKYNLSLDGKFHKQKESSDLNTLQGRNLAKQ